MGHSVAHLLCGVGAESGGGGVPTMGVGCSGTFVRIQFQFEMDAFMRTYVREQMFVREGCRPLGMGAGDTSKILWEMSQVVRRSSRWCGGKAISPHTKGMKWKHAGRSDRTGTETRQYLIRMLVRSMYALMKRRSDL